MAALGEDALTYPRRLAPAYAPFDDFLAVRDRLDPRWILGTNTLFKF
jgi:hypothetical protein